MSKTALIVDDQKSIRALLSNVLQLADYKVIQAEDGAKALNILSGEENIDLIITDLNMPVMDGIQLICETRKLSKHTSTPICMLTTESEQSTLMKDESFSIDMWLTKPIQPIRVLENIKSL